MRSVRGRNGFHVAWVADLEMRHLRGGCGGPWLAPHRPCGNERQGRGDAPRRPTPKRGHRGWLNGAWSIARIVQRQPRLADVAHALTGILDETPRDQRAHTCGCCGRQHRQVGLAREDQSQRFGDRVAREEARACQHFVEHAPERPDVRALVHGLAARLLRRHVRSGAQNHPRLRHGRCRDRRRHRHAR